MRLLAVVAFTVCLAPAAAVAGDGADAPITYHVPGVTVVVQKHSMSIPLKRNLKITWLHKAFTYDCLAANCLVIATPEVQLLGNNAYNLCVYADGKPMKPTCDIAHNGDEMHNLQEKLILQGAHSFQTGINSNSVVQSTVCPCIITYSIYDSGN
jgi:hypothetical protein